MKKPNSERSYGLGPQRSIRQGDEDASRVDRACRQKLGPLPRTRLQKLRLLTYNLREGVQQEKRIATLYKELDKTKYDVIGVCETHLRESRSQRWENGDEHHFGTAGLTEDTKSNIGGVGFIVSAKIAERSLE